MTGDDEPMNGKTILVTGATGKQGGAVVHHVLQRGFAVRAIARKPDSPAAQALKSKGVNIFEGDMEDADSLRQAMHGVDGVFCVQNFWEKGIGKAGEIRQARNVIQIAADAHISHLVLASIAGCDNAHGVEHFESKWEIEKMVDSAHLPRTFIRTVFFMENFLDPRNGPLMFPVLAGALKPGTRFHMIAVRDIGWFVAEAFAKPDEYLGRIIEIAGDSLTVAEMKRHYMDATGKKPANFKLPAWLLRVLNGEMARQLHWNNEVGWHFDIHKLRQLHPELIGFHKFWEAQQRSEQAD
jgi:uncharacterized protein YbjT (DUF2867 family)